MASGGMGDPNKLNHIFANSNHNLDPRVRQFGGTAEVGRAIFEAVDQAFQSSGLILNACGLYEQMFDIGGYSVMIRGRIVSGQVHIGTAWIPPHPWGWSIEPAPLTRAPRRATDSIFLPPREHGDEYA